MLTTYSQGKVRYDDRIHAMVGVPPAAVCQAGLMITRFAGRFESDDPHACARCVAATEHPADGGNGPAGKPRGTDLSIHHSDGPASEQGDLSIHLGDGPAAEQTDLSIHLDAVAEAVEAADHE